MRVLVCSYIKTSRHPRRRETRARARARERTFTLAPSLFFSLSLPLSRNACTRMRTSRRLSYNGVFPYFCRLP